MSCFHPDLDTCNCCGKAEEPIRYNRPGLSALEYRIGTHASFVRRMQERLSLEAADAGPYAGSRPLFQLGTRDVDDPAIALIDAAAVMLDVLTFYQERIANEGYLNTATERRTVLELARAIGYELNPGVAADVTLAFTMDDTPGKAPSRVMVPERTKVQSLPADGGMPQIFETVEDTVARKSWNGMRPRRRFRQELAVTSSGTLERRTRHGNLVHTERIYLAGTGLHLEPGDLVVTHVSSGTAVLRISEVTEFPERATTRIRVAEPSGADSHFDSVEEGTASSTSLEAGPRAMTDVEIGKLLDVELSEADLQIVLEDFGWDDDEFLEAVNPAEGEEVADADEPSDPTEGVFMFRSRVGLFGHNAQAWEALPASQRFGEWAYEDESNYGFQAGPYTTSWEGNTVWEDSQGGSHSDPDLYLERTFDTIVEAGWIVMAGDVSGAAKLTPYQITRVTEASLADYGLSSKVTGLTLALADGTDIAPSSEPDFPLRGTTAHVESQWLELTELAIGGDVDLNAIELDRMVLYLQEGQQVLVSGELVDPEGVTSNEVVTVKEISHQYGRTTLTFQDNLEGVYRRDTVVVNANVAKATHGETVDQSLGGGDGARSNQAFKLAKAPLTYVSAPTVSGAETTLEVRVNGRLWDESRSLYAKQATDELYIVRINDDAEAIVTFGDGVAGARLSTGSENVTARYRTGIGPDGEVDAETLQLLMTRPPGVKSVTNPLPASGSEAPETRDRARVNAPMTVRTLGRVVSLTDFEDFARTFAGIGKAMADVLRLHGTRLVCITVGSATGGQVDDLKLGSLKDAIDALRDPGESICVATYRPLSFDLTGTIKADSKLIEEEVIADVEAALKSAFDFESRSFGRGIAAAEVIAVIQGVAGVVAVDLDQLSVQGNGVITTVVPPFGVLPANRARLQSDATTLDCGTIAKAELLLINPGGISLGRMP